MGEIMKKIIKRVIFFFLSIAITIVSFGSVVNAAEYQTPYKLMYLVNEDDVTKTPYNDDIVPNDFSVESKEITGNEKHFLTWNNDNVQNSSEYVVEIYSVVYIEYKNCVEDMTEEQLKNTEWLEMSLPVIHSVNVDASDCGTVINYSDVKSAYTNGIYQQYDEKLKALSIIANHILSCVAGVQFDGFKDITQRRNLVCRKRRR